MPLGSLFFTGRNGTDGDGGVDRGQMGGGSGRRGEGEVQSGCTVWEKTKQINRRFSPLIRYLGIFETWGKKKWGKKTGQQLHTRATATSKSTLHNSPGYRAPMEAGCSSKLQISRSKQESSVSNVYRINFYRINFYRIKYYKTLTVYSALCHSGLYNLDIFPQSFNIKNISMSIVNFITT